jgi:hypothetical protein
MRIAAAVCNRSANAAATLNTFNTTTQQQHIVSAFCLCANLTCTILLAGFGQKLEQLAAGCRG